VILGNLERRAYPNADAISRFPFLQPIVSGDTEVFAVARPERSEGAAPQQKQPPS
jgi:hypothetical protein